MVADGFYAVEDALAPQGLWIFRVKTQLETAKRWPGQQMITRPIRFGSRTFHPVGVVNESGQVLHAGWTFDDASRQGAIMEAMKLLEDTAAAVNAGKLYARKFGRCYVCNRQLTVADSLDSGIGPECAGTRQHVREL